MDSRVGPRFKHFDSKLDETFCSPYDFTTEEIQDLAQRKVPPFTHYILDLTTAKTETNPFIIEVPGRAFVGYGFVSDTPTNIGLRTRALTAVAYVAIGLDQLQQNNEDRRWYALHNRGYRGDFKKLILTWPAQANTNMDFYVMNFNDMPWMQDG